MPCVCISREQKQPSPGKVTVKAEAPLESHKPLCLTGGWRVMTKLCDSRHTQLLLYFCGDEMRIIKTSPKGISTANESQRRSRVVVTTAMGFQERPRCRPGHRWTLPGTGRAGTLSPLWERSVPSTATENIRFHSNTLRCITARGTRWSSRPLSPRVLPREKAGSIQDMAFPNLHPVPAQK